MEAVLHGRREARSQLHEGCLGVTGETSLLGVEQRGKLPQDNTKGGGRHCVGDSTPVDGCLSVIGGRSRPERLHLRGRAGLSRPEG